MCVGGACVWGGMRVQTGRDVCYVIDGAEFGQQKPKFNI